MALDSNEIKEKNQSKFYYLLDVVKKTQQILEKNKEKTEAQKILQNLEKRLGKDFQNKESAGEQNKEADRLKYLISKKREIRETLDFLNTLISLKSKTLLKITQDLKKSVKELSSGEKYYNILSKIQYIFPKPHAIAYTTTAWKTAYYKVYYPQEFYSVLLTYHVTVYDIWLMTFDKSSIDFRIEKLLESIGGKAKNSEKELISIIKVLQELSKSINGEVKENKDLYLIQKKTEINLILHETKNKIIEQLEFSDEKSETNQNKKIIFARLLPQLNLTEEEKKRTKEHLKINFSNSYALRDWKLSTKEKELLYTLKIILEMKQQNLDFRLGIDFNKSAVKNFQIVNGQILIPFSALAGVGEVAAKKITDYREQKKRINNWKEELAAILNKNHLEQLEYLKKYHLIIEDN